MTRCFTVLRIVSVWVLCALLTREAWAAPSVTNTSPLRNVVAPGESVTLSVAATGNGTLSYQWFRSGRALAAATNANLVLAEANYGNSGWYVVDVRDADGVTRSRAFFLTVAPVGGRLRTWGFTREVLQPPPGLASGIIGVSAWSLNTIVPRRDGTVVAWGEAANNHPTPSGLTDVVGVAAGSTHFSVLRSDGTVVAWGNAGPYPVAVPTGLQDVVEIVVVSNWTVALKSDGTVISFGSANDGAMNVPVGLSGVVGLAGGYQNVAALKNDGTVVTWKPVGAASGGDWGVGSGPPIGVVPGTPEPPLGFTASPDLVSLAIGGTLDATVAVARGDGSVWTWLLGKEAEAAPATGLAGVVKVSMGLEHGLALRSDGTVAPWGLNSFGQATVPGNLGRVFAVKADGIRSLALDDGSTTVLAPAITTEPVSRSTDVDQAASFTVQASGENLNYRWQSRALPEQGGQWEELFYNDVRLNGTGTPTLTITPWLWKEDQQFRCVVRNDAGFAVSAVVTLSINLPKPEICTQPEDAYVTAGASWTFSAEARSAKEFSYRWQVRAPGSSTWTDQPETPVVFSYAYATATTQLTLSATEGSHGTKVRCVFTNAAGSQVSEEAGLFFKDTLAISASGAGRTVATAGQVLVFEGAATSTLGHAVSYRWKHDNRPIPGATQSTLVIPQFSRELAGAYTFEATDAVGASARITRFVLADLGATQIRGWGSNRYGQLVPLAPLTDAIAVAAGTDYTVALKRDGSLQAYGGRDLVARVPTAPGDFVAVGSRDSSTFALTSAGGYRLFGYSTAPYSSPPSELIALAGADYLFALRSDGQVDAYSWSTSPSAPRRIKGLREVVSIAAGRVGVWALKADGTVMRWRSGWDLESTGLSGVTAIAGGFEHLLALKADGTVVAIGVNEDGQTTVPTNLAGAKEIAAGPFHSLAWAQDGPVFGWGRNDLGQSTPPEGLPEVFALAGSFSHSLALCAAAGAAPPVITQAPVDLVRSVGTSASFMVEASGAGTLTYRWWRNGVRLFEENGPTLVIPAVAATDAGEYFVTVGNHVGTVASGRVALAVTGSEVPPMLTTAQPRRVTGESGQPLTLSVHATSANLPLTYQWKRQNRIIPGATGPTYTLPAFTNADAGPYTVVVTDSLWLKDYHTTFVQPSYGRTQVRSWGDGPVLPADLPDDVIALAGGDRHVLALRANGTVLAWGSNANGQLNVPTGLSDVVAIAARGNHNVALRADGTVVDWPLSSGYLSQLTRVVAIATNGGLGIALKADGSVAHWDSSGLYLPPVQAQATDVVAIAAASYALRADGTLISWGGLAGVTTRPGVADIKTGTGGSLIVQADGTMIRDGWFRDPPAGLDGRRRIEIGYRHAVYQKDDGTVGMWGSVASRAGPMPADLGVVWDIAAGSEFSLALRPVPAATANRAPTAEFYLSGQRTLGQTIAVSLNVDDPDGNYAFSNLRVYTPAVGWRAVRADDSVVAAPTISADLNAMASGGAATRQFHLASGYGVGSYVFTFVAEDAMGARVEAPPVLLTVIAPVGEHTGWMDRYFSETEKSDSAISGPHADPDGDGLSNLFEYALGLEPRTATSANTSGLPEVGASASEWTCTYTRPSDRSDVTYTVEISTTLTSWTATNVTHELVSTDSVAGTQTWRARTPLATGANVFFRLKVETP